LNEDRVVKKLREKAIQEIRDVESTKILNFEKSRPPCCTKTTLVEILEMWGIVQEQLADCYLGNSHHFVQRGKWLLNAIKKYQDAILLDPQNYNLHFRVGCGYGAWLKTKIESGSTENLTLENVWLKNAEMSWLRALQYNPYHVEVYKLWGSLYSFLGDRATDLGNKQKFLKLAREKMEMQARVELLSQQVMNMEFLQEMNQ